LTFKLRTLALAALSAGAAILLVPVIFPKWRDQPSADRPLQLPPELIAQKPELTTLVQTLDAPEMREADLSVERARSRLEQPRADHQTSPQEREDFVAAHPRRLKGQLQTFLHLPRAIDAGELLRDSLFNPRDVTIPAAEIAVLEDLLRAHHARFEELQAAISTQSERVVIELATDGQLESVEQASRRIRPADLERVRVEARQLAEARRDAAGRELDVERAVASAVALAVKNTLDADAVLSTPDGYHIVPTGRLDGPLREWLEYRRFLSLEMLQDCLRFFVRGRALTPAEAVQAVEAYDSLARRSPLR
jgi:hypothetical protein